jgi:D-glycero-alpha-D-manno-heptose-7-phosphate kinase
MVISRTPFRISFLGGGSDYPAWYRQHGGSVLGSSIDKYCYLTVRYLPPFFEHRLRVVYSKIETCHSIDEIQHPVVRCVLRELDERRGVEIHHDGDLPARSGMGSSSAFTVGLLHAMHALRGQMLSKRDLAMASIHLEQEVLRETVGSQDQVLAAYGGLNHVTFARNGEITVRPVTVTRDRIQELNARLMLFYTGIARTASEVAQTYVTALDTKLQQMDTLSQMVEEGIAILTSGGDLLPFGRLLHDAWTIKRELGARVSNADVERIYEDARAAGAAGGKLMGAGGGGFMLLFVEPARREAVRQALANLVYVPVQLEFSGSQIIFYDPEKDYSLFERNHTLKPFRELAAGEKLGGERGR